LRLKTDSYVVETDTHFPTDYNLLWDSARKCLDSIKHLGVPGWRKRKDWYKSLKKLMRTVGQVSSSGGKNKEERVKGVALEYLKKARTLEEKVACVLVTHLCRSTTDLAYIEQLTYYHQMLTKHIELLDRRLVKGEKKNYAPM
jgi:hypothetical protein